MEMSGAPEKKQEKEKSAYNCFNLFGKERSKIKKAGDEDEQRQGRRQAHSPSRATTSSISKQKQVEYSSPVKPHSHRRRKKESGTVSAESSHDQVEFEFSSPEEVKPQSQRRRKKEPRTVSAESSHDQAEDRKRKRNQEHEKSKVKKTKYTNPFQVEKSKYNLRTFEAVNPFVDVTVVPATKHVPWLTKDKVGDGLQIDRGILDAAYEQICSEVFCTLKGFKDPKTELGGRPIHCAYLSALWYCTRQMTTTAIAPKRYLESELESEVDKGDAGDNYDDTEDIEVKAGGQTMLKLEVPTSDEILDLATEGDDPSSIESVDVELKTKYDFKVRVVDKRINKNVTVLVIECEWEKLSINKSFQAAGYAMKDAANNMKQGRFEPIFLQAWGESAWPYGIVIPCGLVRIKNGEIIQLHGLSKEETKLLHKRLRKKTRKLELEYDISAYPDGEYVAGSMFIFQKKFTFSFHDFKLNDETRFFIQSLLRIVVGDRILSWSLKDFKEVLDARIQERIQAIQRLTGGWTP